MRTRIAADAAARTASTRSPAPRRRSVRGSPRAGCVGVEPPEVRDDALHQPAPASIESGDPRPGARTDCLRHPSGERVDVERGEVADFLAHPVHLEPRRRADRDQSGERAREAIEVGLHQRALLVLEQLHVALPDQVSGRPSCLRRRGPVGQDPAPAVDRLEAREHGGVVGRRPRAGSADGRFRARSRRRRGGPRRCR